MNARFIVRSRPTTVTDATAFAPSSCVVTANNCNGDGVAEGLHGGISANGGSNRIEGNHITYADVALYLRVPGDTGVRNSLHGNTTPVNAVRGNDPAPFATALAATNPWSNNQN